MKLSAKQIAALSAIAGSAVGAAAGAASKRVKRVGIKVPYMISGRKMKKTKRYSKRGTKRARRVRKKSLGGRVKTLEKKMKVGKATHVHLNAFAGQTVTLLRQQNMSHINANHPASTLDTIIAGLRYYDPNTNTLKTNDPSSLTASQTFSIKQYGSFLGRNAGTIPLNVTVNVMKLKKNCDLDTVTAFTNGMADQNNPATTSTMLSPFYSRQLNEYWKLEKKVTKYLRAGEQIYVGCNTPWITYDPSSVDSENPTYNTDLGARAYLVQISGVIGHGNSGAGLTEVTPLECALDYQVIRRTVVYYEAGTNLRDFTISDARVTAFTAGTGVTGFSPVGDNATYSRT